jgi:hypothetical protein
MLLRGKLIVGLLVLVATAAAADQRPPLKAVSAIRLGNYGSPSVMIEAREQVRQIVNELNALRSKPWRQGDTKLSCYATLVLLDKGKPVGLFRLTPDVVVERPSEKGQTSYSLAVTDTDTPRLRRLLTEIAAPKCE